jgi:hypothetical protein
MESKAVVITSRGLVAIGTAAGLVIAAVDNFAFEGEVSPIVIVVMLCGVTAIAGGLFMWRGWLAAACVWVCLPLAHLSKHVLGLSDTLNPNTYMSIMMLATFTFLISAIGFGAGVLLRRLASGSAKPGS